MGRYNYLRLGRRRHIHEPLALGADASPPHERRVSQSVPLEDVQYLAGHADPRTTRLYDRRQQKVTRNIVERISI
jgi:hypothetical protein